MINWRDIPGNADVFARLSNAMEQEKAIAFVGAGASFPLYPLWSELIELLMEQAINSGLASEADRTAWRRMQAQDCAERIREKLGAGLYRRTVAEIFSRPRGSNARRYTLIHETLVMRRFRGFVTTNYDDGLLEARQHLVPGVTATNWTTWIDDQVRLWLNGDIFRTEKCPILFAHGIHVRPDTMVLGVGEYRKAYKSGPWRRCFERLWSQDVLVFVGFGFSDPWLDFIADEVITQTSGRDSAPRHFAILGRKEDDGAIAEERRRFMDRYNAYVLFYPVIISDGGGEDHQYLVSVLRSLPDAPTTAVPPLPSDSESSPEVPNRAAAERANFRAPPTQHVSVDQVLERWQEVTEASLAVLTAALQASGHPAAEKEPIPSTHTAERHDEPAAAINDRSQTSLAFAMKLEWLIGTDPLLANSAVQELASIAEPEIAHVIGFVDERSTRIIESYPAILHVAKLFSRLGEPGAAALIDLVKFGIWNTKLVAAHACRYVTEPLVKAKIEGAMYRLLQDDDPDLIKPAIVALGQLGAVRTANRIVEVARNDEDHSYDLYALDSLLRLIAAEDTDTFLGMRFADFNELFTRQRNKPQALSYVHFTFPEWKGRIRDYGIDLIVNSWLNSDDRHLQRLGADALGILRVRRTRGNLQRRIRELADLDQDAGDDSVYRLAFAWGCIGASDDGSLDVLVPFHKDSDGLTSPSGEAGWG